VVARWQIHFVLRAQEIRNSLRILSLGDRRTARFSDVRSREPIGSMFSPDGRWIDLQPLWSRDSTELLDVAPNVVFIGTAFSPDGEAPPPRDGARVNGDGQR
jgi:hypothetical protein